MVEGDRDPPRTIKPRERLLPREASRSSRRGALYSGKSRASERACEIEAFSLFLFPFPPMLLSLSSLSLSYSCLSSLFSLGRNLLSSLSLSLFLSLSLSCRLVCGFSLVHASVSSQERMNSARKRFRAAGRGFSAISICFFKQERRNENQREREREREREMHELNNTSPLLIRFVTSLITCAHATLTMPRPDALKGQRGLISATDSNSDIRKSRR